MNYNYYVYTNFYKQVDLVLKLNFIGNIASYSFGSFIQKYVVPNKINNFIKNKLQTKNKLVCNFIAKRKEYIGIMKTDLSYSLKLSLIKLLSLQ